MESGGRKGTKRIRLEWMESGGRKGQRIRLGRDGVSWEKGTQNEVKE